MKKGIPDAFFHYQTSLISFRGTVPESCPYSRLKHDGNLPAIYYIPGNIQLY